MLYNILSHAHSINRWLVLIFLILAIVSAISARNTMNVASSTGKIPLPKFALPAFITTHIQLLLGLVLYFAPAGIKSPWVVMDKEIWAGEQGEIFRFYSIDHFTYMLLAIILITVGYMVAKRAKTSARSSAWILGSYGVGLIVILASIPWPWRALQGGWW